MFDYTTRQGVIAEIAKRTDERGMNLGKTALQKHVYFLQTLQDIDVGYDFRLYTYGPFSSQLLSDLDTLAFVDGVDITYDSSVSGYRIKPGDNADSITEEAEDFLGGASAAIDAVLGDFGDLTAKDLELRATIVFAEREYRDKGTLPKRDKLAETVRGIKPHFSAATILGAIKELEEKDHIMLKD